MWDERDKSGKFNIITTICFTVDNGTTSSHITPQGVLHGYPFNANRTQARGVLERALTQRESVKPGTYIVSQTNNGSMATAHAFKVVEKSWTIED